MKNNKANSGISTKANAQRINRACSVIIPLCFFSLLIALFLAFCANDVYAFVKPEGEVSLQLSGERSLYETALMLEDAGVIKNPALFCAYVSSKERSDILTSAEGDIPLERSMSYREILKVFAKNQRE